MNWLTPNEEGWYWAKDDESRWLMAYVDLHDDEVLFWYGDDPSWEPDRHKIDAPAVEGIEAWYGPFGCPGYDHGETTIVISEEYHKKAEELGKAIVIEHHCFEHCSDDKSGGSVTMFSWRTREEALELQVVETRYRELRRLAERYVTLCEESMDEDEMAPEFREVMNDFKGILQKPGG